MRILDTSEAAIAEAVTALADGEIIAYPAETMYGLGVDPMSTRAIEQLFKVKGRPESNPIPVVIAGEDQLPALVRETTSAARKLMARFWPGPLSLVLPKAKGVPDALTAGRDDICVRCPASPIARSLCTRFGRGITSTSANASGKEPVCRITDLDLIGVFIALDAGDLKPGPPSTIYDVLAGNVLRVGAIEPDAITACLAD